MDNNFETKFEPQHPSPIRVTKEQIDKRIAECTYTRVGDTTTICHIKLDNGYTVIGQSACVDKENFNVVYGRQLACEDARRKLWPLFGFVLAEDIHRSHTDQAARASAVKRREEKNHAPNGVIWGEPSGGLDTSPGNFPDPEASVAKPEALAGHVLLTPFAARPFGEAIDHMHRGGKVRRRDWSPDVFLTLDKGLGIFYLMRDGDPHTAPWRAEHKQLLATDWESWGLPK